MTFDVSSVCANAGKATMSRHKAMRQNNPDFKNLLESTGICWLKNDTCDLRLCAFARNLLFVVCGICELKNDTRELRLCAFAGNLLISGICGLKNDTRDL